MGEKGKVKQNVSPRSIGFGIGFVACYKGKTIASASSFDKLSDRAEVRELLGKKGLVIKHTVPEGMLAVY